MPDPPPGQLRVISPPPQNLPQKHSAKHLLFLSIPPIFHAQHERPRRRCQSPLAFLSQAASKIPSRRAGARGGGCAASPRCVSIFSITSGCSITETIFRLPPHSQRSMSMSNTRFKSRAQLMRTGALCACACSPVCVVAGSTFGATCERSFAFGASTP